MKKICMAVLALALAASLSARADGDERGGNGRQREKRDRGEATPAKPERAQVKEQAKAGGERVAKAAHTRESARRKDAAVPAAAPEPRQAIRLGRRDHGTERQPERVQERAPERAQGRAQEKVLLREARSARQGNVAHHQTVTEPDAFHARLKVLGVERRPERLMDREHLLDTDRKHSVIRYPDRDDHGKVLGNFPIKPRQWNDPVVRNHMTLLLTPDHVGLALRWNGTENRPGRYYWHHDRDLQYCHYLDDWGFHWYGWYVGTSYFWTRYYNDRWWFYDSDLGRWNFWVNGAWWWQDPYHVGDLYLYDNERYLPAAPAPAETVSTVEPADAKVFRSADDSRMVKVMGDSADAFLYDTSIPPNFDPIYLASKVKAVKFSDTSNGKPLQILLTLQDDSFNLFDADGTPAGFGDGPPKD